MTRKIQNNSKKSNKTLKRRRTGGHNETNADDDKSERTAYSRFANFNVNLIKKGDIHKQHIWNSQKHKYEKSEGDYNIILYALLDEAANKSTLDNDYLAKKDFKEYFNIILKEISDINIEIYGNRDGDNALHQLFRIESHSSVYYLKELLKKGIDVVAFNIEGDTPMHVLASVFSSFEYSNEVLKGIFTYMTRALNPPTSNALAQVFKARNKKGLTPLHQLIISIGNRSEPLYMDDDRWSIFVEYLIKVGSDINERDEDGRTPLMFAAENVDIVRVKGLVKRPFYADITLQDDEDMTALDYVERSLKQYPRKHADKPQEYVDKIKSLLGDETSGGFTSRGGKRNKRRTKTIKKKNISSKRNAKKRTYRRKHR